MVWRLVDRRSVVMLSWLCCASCCRQGRTIGNGVSLAAFRAALVEHGGEELKTLLDQQLDQVTDMDLMIGVPQQRGANGFPPCEISDPLMR